MKNSIVNPKLQFDDTQWLISVLNTGIKLGGHAILVVEGLENDFASSLFKRSFLGQYDILATLDPIQKSSINKTGYINEIRVFENSDKVINYHKYPSESYRVPVLNAKNMIESIKQDKIKTDAAIRNLKRDQISEAMERDDKGDIIKPLRYQFLGNSHPLVKFFGNTDAGDNCAGWCLEKLTEGAGLEDHEKLPKPKVVSGQCCNIL